MTHRSTRSDAADRSKSTLKLAGILALLLACAALAAPQDGSTPADAQDTPPPSEIDLRRAGLDATPFTSELLGISIHLPYNAQVTVQPTEEGVSVLVSDPSVDPPQWTMRIGQLESNMDVPTPRHEVDAHIRSLDAAGREYTVLRNDDHRIRNATGRHLTIRQPPATGIEPIISGWMLIQNSAKTFVVLSYVTTPAVYQRLQPLLDASLDTIHITSKDDLESERFNRIIRGVEFLSSLGEEQLRAMVGEEEWFRVYRTTAAGEEELGYSFVQVTESMRGEIEPSRSEDKYNPGEHAKGLMITVKGRVINDAARKVFTDSVARFWLSWDQSDEVWSVRATIRQGDASLTETETGARHETTHPNPRRDKEGVLTDDDDERSSGASGIIRRTLTVVKSSQRDQSNKPITWEVPHAYLSQGLGWLVGRLMAHADAKQSTQSYYFYDPTSDRLALRTDEWAESTDGTGRWILRTRLGTDAPPITSYYDDRGALLIQKRVDGATIEPIALAALRQLWREKGLPTTTSDDQ